jgi:hypothetical protein
MGAVIEFIQNNLVLCAVGLVFIGIVTGAIGKK